MKHFISHAMTGQEVVSWLFIISMMCIAFALALLILLIGTSRTYRQQGYTFGESIKKALDDLDPPNEKR